MYDGLALDTDQQNSNIHLNRPGSVNDSTHKNAPMHLDSTTSPKTNGRKTNDYLNGMTNGHEKAFHDIGNCGATNGQNGSGFHGAAGGHVHSSDQNRFEPIAVIGMSLKFPGDAVSADALWDMLLSRRCVSKEFPKDRINIDAFYDPNPKRPNRISTRTGHFLEEDVRAFDAPFFSIPPTEAGTMDPQQRGLMEVTYQALENAGISMEAVAGSNTSVHVGCFTADYLTMSWRDSQQIPKYSATGTAASILSNRVSWFFDLRGASMTVDTACSSALVALDLACNGLWSGASNMAIVGGANLICSPELNIALSNMSFLSPDGRCHSFDHRANGYARGEGFGVLILKPISQALKDGDTIRALIRSVGTNQDGHTNGGITQPSKDLQAQLIAETYRKAGLDMGLTRFFEAHGTGTAIGDPIEARAIGESFRDYRSSADPLIVGAVKSNLGHLEGASGLASIIKTVLVLEKGLIPPNANFEQLNPQIDVDFLKLKFSSESIPWPCGGLRRASVNSFGFGGTNAHVVLDDAYHYLQARNLPSRDSVAEVAIMQPDGLGTNPMTHVTAPLEKASSISPMLLVLSAADEEGIGRLAESYSQYFAKLDETLSSEYLNDLAFTLSTRRSSLAWKSYTIVDSVLSLQNIKHAMAKPARTPFNLRLGFAFTGQGAQWFAMGRELMNYSIFKKSLIRSQTYLTTLLCDWNLFNELEKDESRSRVSEPEFSQTLSTAIQIALVDLFTWLDIAPAVVVGHSSGEIAAAYCAGFLSHRSAIRVAYYRGVLASKLAHCTLKKNTMVSVGLSQSQTTLQLRKLESEQTPRFKESLITLSCINSPTNVTVSGPNEQMDILITHLRKQGIFARKLKVNVAYHSPQMHEIASEYLVLLQDLESNHKRRDVRMMSSVTSEIISMETACTGEYWVQNMISPVNFHEAMRLCCFRSSTSDIVKKLDRSHLNEIVTHSWVEVGPHSALQGPIRDIVKSVQRSNEISYSSALVRNMSAITTFLETIGRLYSQNFKIDMSKLQALASTCTRSPKVLSDLPQYPFNHAVLYWEESQINRAFRFRQHPTHDLLGAPVGEWNPFEAKWKLIIKIEDLPWVADHKINGSTLYPAAGMLVMAIEASKLLAQNRSPIGFEIKNAEFPAPLLIPATPEGLEVHITLNPKAEHSNQYEFQILVQKSDSHWEKVCHGSVCADYGQGISEVDNGKEAICSLSQLQILHEQAQATYFREIDTERMYKQLREDVGLDYGPSFQCLDQVRSNDSGEAIAHTVPFTWSDKPFFLDRERDHVIHPTTLDGFFQLAFVALSKGGSAPLRTMVPTRVGRLWVSSLGAGNSTDDLQKAHVRAETVSQRLARCFTSVLSKSDQNLRVQIQELEITAISGSHNTQKLQGPKHLCYHMDQRVDVETLDACQIQAYCEKARQVRSDPTEWFQDIETLALSFSVQALEEIKKLNREPAEPLARYAAWLQTQIDRDLAATPEHVRQQRQGVLHDKDRLTALCKKMTSSNKRGELHVKVGLGLTNMLLGEVDPLQFLFGDEQLLADFYGEMNASSTAFDAVAAYLDVAVHKNPGMKFLEIGAGTGATTATILPSLIATDGTPRFEHYLFTDLSPSFFDKARESLGDQSRIQHRILNIEENLSEQGFGGAEYDIVIAAMVLHATKDLENTVRNTRRLLKPGGKLIFMEPTVPNITRTGFIFGLLPGWWLSSEDYRQQSPCITEQEWNGLLQRNSFSGTELIFKDYEATECHGWSVMVSTALVETPTSIEIPNATLILNSRTSSQQALAEQLSLQLEALGKSTDILSLGEAALLDEIDIDQRSFIFLGDLEGPTLRNLAVDSFSALKVLLGSAGSLLWVTRGGGATPSSPDYAMVNGLCRVCRHENQRLSLVTLALESTERTLSTEDVTHIVRVFGLTAPRSRWDEIEPEYVEVNGMLQINRLVQATYLNDHVFTRTAQPVSIQEFGAGPPLKLGVRVPGLLDSLEFLEDESIRKPLGAQEVLIKVHAIGVNFKECLTILGRVNLDELGSDCAGLVSETGRDCAEFRPGDRVLACVTDTYRTFARAHAGQVVKIPDTMGFTEAAAYPTAFSTAYYSLYEVARLQKGETVLIHAASGGTGQLAVQIAIDIGAEVFATVGFLSKKQLLMDVYGIPEDHIFYSRDTSFAKGIQRMTRGNGVDVVLNSLSGDGLVASWECIAPFGRFVEIGRRDIDSRGSLPMYPFIRNASFSGVDLAAITGRGNRGKKILEAIISMKESGRLQPPYPLHTYPLSELEQAFRFLQSGQSSGKIVLEVTPNALVPTVSSSRSNFSFDSGVTYVVAGGLGGIGRNISRWLVSRGAKNLLLLSRSGSRGNIKAQALLTDLQAKGVKVECPTCDVTDMQALQTRLRECSKTMPPIKGCFQATMVLKDATFTGMSFSDWKQSTLPKVQGSWNLHSALPPQMDFFIMLSSVCGVFGNGGQSNYAAGNTYQDALAEFRRSRGEKAVALDLGIVLSEGFVAENQHVMDRLLRLGLFLPLEQEELFALFDHYCNPATKLANPSQSQVITGLELPTNMLANGSEIPLAMRKPLFSHMHQIDSSGPGSSRTVEQALDLKATFKKARNLSDAGLVVAEAFKVKLSRMMGIPLGDIDLQHRVESYGVDSLVAVELRNWLAKEFGADVAVFEILGGATLGGVGHTAATKSTFRPSQWEE